MKTEKLSGLIMFIGGVVLLSLLVPWWVEAQQKPSPVLIYCQDSSGNMAPCLGGNQLDYDTGGGTANQGTVGIVLPASGGPVAGGTSGNPFRTDPTGTTPQPVTAASLPLPAGAATESSVDGIEGLLGTSNTNTGNTSSGVGATSDAAATAGSTGSLNAKLRLITTQLASVLTTTAHDAAFGTAGTPDAQVRSVQGVASGTPVGVQSNGANLATEATLSTSNTNTSNTASGIGATGDAAATAGSTGSLNAKLRLMTTQLNAIQTAVELIDNDQTGATMFHRISVGTTEDEHQVKGSAGRLFSISATNTNAAVRYLRCADQVAASTTPGTTAVWFGMAIPGNTTGAGFTVPFGPAGAAFSTGLTCWFVTGAAETDVAEVAANEVNANYVYK